MNLALLLVAVQSWDEVWRRGRKLESPSPASTYRTRTARLDAEPFAKNFGAVMRPHPLCAILFGGYLLLIACFLSSCCEVIAHGA